MRGLITIAAASVCIDAFLVSGFAVTQVGLNSRRENVLGGNFMANSDDEGEKVKVPRRGRRGRFYDDEEEETEFFNKVEQNVYGNRLEDDEVWEYDEDDEDDLYDEEEEDYGLFSNVIIDNPILDSIDPDGAAERFPELARDPRFWFDMVLFIAFLNFLSAIGPQDYFPDIPFDA